MNYAGESFDFPCSDTFRGYAYEYYGEPDPDYIPPQPDLTEIENRLNNLESEMARLNNMPRRYDYPGKVNKLEAKRPSPNTNFEDITSRYMR